MTLDQRVTLGAVALSVVYAAVLVALSSPVSFYTLDDPYIHMALAENIARGHFGVNLGEVSNPSSSVLWPWLLAAFDKVGLVLWAPLLVNVACFVITVRVMLAFCLSRLAPEGRDAANVLILLGLALLAFNVFGVIFTGMEHSLHVALSVIAVTRAIDGRYDAITLAALVFGPLVRFEGAIILAFGVGAALADRRWRFAAAALVAASALFVLYALWLGSIGLPILPSSVLSKSAVTSGVVDGGGGVLAGLAASFLENAQSAAAPLLAVLAIGLIYGAIKRTARDRLIAFGLIAVLILAMMLGRMNSYARYEVYVLCAVGVGLVHLLQHELRRLLVSRIRVFILGAGLCLLGASLGPYVIASTPQAARNVERQQYQMHRVIDECWRRPVAVNDLGWTSFRNDGFVLDLWGLGSERARKARQAAEPGWMNALVQEKGVELVMIYAEWFPDLPKDWTRVGMLVDSERKVTPYASAVQIYAARPEAADAIRACLRHVQRPGGPAIVIAE